MIKPSSIQRLWSETAGTRIRCVWVDPLAQLANLKNLLCAIEAGHNAHSAESSETDT